MLRAFEQDPGPMTLAPTLASGVVLLDERSRVLLIKENYDRRRWGLPGGAVELGETPAEAAIREVAEETGLTVGLDGLIALYYLRTQRRGLRFIFAGSI
jgi:8-oxo-dGTP pyrophosphatase MutT (NUDIX family)